MKSSTKAHGVVRLISGFLVALAGGWGVTGEAASAPKALFEQIDLFIAGQDGVFEYRIPGLITSTRGTLLAFCDARVRRAGDPPNKINLVLKRSFDGGMNWSAMQTIAENGQGAVADSCGLVDRTTGTLWIFSVYAPEGIGSANARPGWEGDTFQFKAIKSDDDGATWSKPVDLTPMVKKPEWSAGSTGIGSGIQLRSGRLIVPRYFADYHEPRTILPFGASYLSYSDDHGATWKIGATVNAAGGTNECQVVELSDGSLLLNMRGLQGNHRKVARSQDGGLTWSDAVEDPLLIEPRCQGSLQTYTTELEHERNRLLFANPASLERKNFTVRMSYDEGRTWPLAKTLHRGPAAYSCLTVLSDLTAACLYERGDQKPYEKITFARFNLEWLSEGQDRIEPRPQLAR